MYGTPPDIPGLVQTNITNTAEEKWALLDKDIEMEDSETENEKGKGRTILHHTKLRMRREMEEQFYETNTISFHSIIKLDKNEYYFNSLEIRAFAVLLPSAS